MTSTAPNTFTYSENDTSDGPSVIVFRRQSQLMTTIKEIIHFLLLVSPSDFYHGKEKTFNRNTGKQLTSIEVDPDEENEGESSSSNRPQSKSSPFIHFPRCLTTKRYAFLIGCGELLGLLYLMSTALVIYTKDLSCSWFFQPFLAPLWLHHPTGIFSTICVFCSIGFVVIVCLLQALGDRAGVKSTRLVLPHLIIQLLTIFATLMFALTAVVLLTTQGTFALRILELAGSSIGNGILGMGNIILGLEYGRISTTAAERVLVNAGVPTTRINITTTSPSSVIHYNMIGGIWETFSYEISLAVAVIVFACICAAEIFAFLIIRRLYAQRLFFSSQSAEQGEMRRRRYVSDESQL